MDHLCPDTSCPNASVVEALGHLPPGAPGVIGAPWTVCAGEAHYVHGVRDSFIWKHTTLCLRWPLMPPVHLSTIIGWGE